MLLCLIGVDASFAMHVVSKQRNAQVPAHFQNEEKGQLDYPPLKFQALAQTHAYCL